MAFRALFVGIATASLLATPVAAQAPVREPTPVEAESLRGHNPVLPIVLIFAILAALLALSAGNEEPTSP